MDTIQETKCTGRRGRGRGRKEGRVERGGKMSGKGEKRMAERERDECRGGEEITAHHFSCSTAHILHKVHSAMQLG